MLFKKYLIYFTFWSLLWITQYAQALSLTLNKNVVTVGDILTISASIESTTITVDQVDVYLSVQLPNGELYYLADLNAKFGDLNFVTPLVTQWSIVTLSDVEIVSFEIPAHLPNGTYKWHLTLCQVDQDVTQPANWIASASASLTFSSGAYESSTAGRPAVAELKSTYPAMLPPPASIATDDSTVGKISADYAWEEEMIDEPMSIPVYEGETNNLQSGTLTAGNLDDNLNFTAFQDYLNQQLQADHAAILPIINLSDRVTLHVVDENGQGVGNAQVQITPPQSQSATTVGLTATNGDFYLFPQFNLGKQSNTTLQLTIAPPQDAMSSPSTAVMTTIDMAKINPDQAITLTLPQTIATLSSELDVMLVIDTTGSMGDELTYIATEFRDIIGTVVSKHPHIAMRFGLTVYRDEGDAYVVQGFDFTESINIMQNQLGKQSATGGGDYPEAMEQAMQTALQAQWRQGNVARLLFLIADAPPHDENLSDMLVQIQQAKQAGIRVYPLAASGVADVAEYIMRIASTVTQGQYLFLTDDSGVGGGHATPSSRCYVVTRLDQLISRMIASELAGQRIEPAQTEIIRTVGQYDQGRCN